MNWSFLVEHLEETNWHIVAPDWRGHGETEWVGPGGYYHFNDYVRDLHQIAATVRRDKLVVQALHGGHGGNLLAWGIPPAR